VRFPLATALLASAFLAAALPIPALSNVPSITNSSVPSCLPMCPAADMTYTVIVRDLANNPIPGSNVMIDFGNCPAIRLCSPTPYDGYSTSTPTKISKATDASGQVTFAIHGGGVCAPSGVVISADGVLLSLSQNVVVTSPDQDANLFVDATDATLMVAKPAGDLTADLNCSGFHSTADDIVLASHLHHICLFIDPVLPHTWGQVKQIYR
jgi:hypothetical protein